LSLETNRNGMAKCIRRKQSNFMMTKIMEKLNMWFI